MEENKEIISGIHNWCDRWCERCDFATRCAVGIELAQDTEEEKDPNNEAFWNKLQSSVAKGMMLLEEMVRERGYDPEEIKLDDESYRKIQEVRETAIKNHPAAPASTEYMMMVKKWMSSNALEEKSEEANMKIQLGIQDEEDSLSEAMSINEYLEIIQYYHQFITVKVRRAIMEWVSGIRDNFEEYEKPENGSCKIALIAIERSMAAWAGLMAAMPAQEDAILDLMAKLQQLERMLLQTFPHAMEFIRPGFDEDLES